MLIDPADIHTCIVDPLPPQAGSAPMNVPIAQTSLFSFPDFQSLIDGLAEEQAHHVYSRGQNPTVEVLEAKLAALEGGQACKCFGSGMGAVSAVLLGLLEAGDHVLFVNQVYGPTLQLAAHLRRFGIAHDVLLDLDPDAVRRALRPETRLLWLESPGTMLFRVADIAAIASVARERGVPTCVDNSWATPLLQKPLALGAELVVHSASKYLAGHSDLMAGAVVGSATTMARIFQRAYMLNGAVLAPHDAWLLLRGMRTLPVRLPRHEADALQVARFLQGHAAVRKVYHPALVADADLLARQQRGHTGLFSFTLADDAFARVHRVIDALQVFRIGVSWGGVESLVISPDRGERGGPTGPNALPPALIRLSIGLEGADPLIADLERALGSTR